MPALPHAILIEGGSHEGRLAKAMELLKEHFSDDPMAAVKLDQGSFEDLTVVEPEEGKKEITAPLIEKLVELFKQKPFASTGRACLMPRGELMNQEAQNKLLKLLEEPAKGNVILILTANAMKLYSTVRSRCMRVWLGYQAPPRGRMTDDIRQLAGALVYRKATLAEAGQILSRYEGSAGEASEFLLAYQLFLRSLIVGRLAPELIGGHDEEGRMMRDSAAKIQEKHAGMMQKGVLLAEKALGSIERGGRVRYAMRSMALATRVDAQK